MEFKTVAFLNPHTRVKDARKIVESQKNGRTTLYYVVISAVPWKIHRWYLAGGGHIEQIAADKYICAECATVRSNDEMRYGSTDDHRLARYCRKCQRECASARMWDQDLRSSLKLYDPIVHYTSPEGISYINIA